MVKKKVKKFDWKIAAKKFGMWLLMAVVTGVIVMWQDKPEYIVLMPLLLAGQNWLKNRN